MNSDASVVYGNNEIPKDMVKLADTSQDISIDSGKASRKGNKATKKNENANIRNSLAKETKIKGKKELTGVKGPVGAKKPKIETSANLA